MAEHTISESKAYLVDAGKFFAKSTESWPPGGFDETAEFIDDH